MRAFLSCIQSGRFAYQEGESWAVMAPVAEHEARAILSTVFAQSARCPQSWIEHPIGRPAGNGTLGFAIMCAAESLAAFIESEV